MSLKTFPMTLKNSFMLTPKVKHFVFQSQQPSPFDYLPGQFITLFFEYNGKTLKRSYSIANSPQKNNLIEFSAGYREGGPGSQFLFDLKTGDTVLVAGPFGRLILKETTPTRYILVATSTGVTPYRAMLETLQARMKTNTHLETIILQGVRTRQDLLFGDEFLAFSAHHTNASFHAYYSQEKNLALQAHEHIGYVQNAFDTLDLSPVNDMVYLCGNPSMIDESFAMLKEKSFPIERIIREKYISN